MLLERLFLSGESIADYLPSVVRYQIAFNDPQTDQDLEDPENQAKLLRFLHRSSSDPRPVGEFQVTKDMLAGIGENQLSSMLTEKVCESNFLFQRDPHLLPRSRKHNANELKIRISKPTWMPFRGASMVHVSFADFCFKTTRVPNLSA